ncbi:hypothetical protein KGQ27_03285 [Patescibacteria group bacterium]|nr:hypothetical protein [Patescibacteria group bacterium]MDE1946716.1 hypothetical protein [Patescibacteria group bacterium]MDE2010981.1 hypothetical protein [Patescibacteria group bacterium]
MGGTGEGVEAGAALEDDPPVGGVDGAALEEEFPAGGVTGAALEEELPAGGAVGAALEEESPTDGLAAGAALERLLSVVGCAAASAGKAIIVAEMAKISSFLFILM